MKKECIWCSEQFGNCLFLEERVLKVARQIGRLREVDCQKEHECYVKLSCSPQNLCATKDKALFLHAPRIGNRCGVSRNENKQFGSVAEAVITYREKIQNIRRYMIDENQPKRQPTEEI